MKKPVRAFVRDNLVFFCRPCKIAPGRNVGTGHVIMQGKDRVCINMRGALRRCNSAPVRIVSSEENMGLDLGSAMDQDLHDWLDKGKCCFLDCSGDRPPLDNAELDIPPRAPNDHQKFLSEIIFLWYA